MNQTEIDELRRLHEADSAKIINAMANIDWQQHLMNAGGCFHVEDDGRLCGRADRWSGHGEPDFHMFVPLYVAATKLAKGNALPALLDAAEERDRLKSRLAALVALPVLKRFKARVDPRGFNGAALLGLRGLVFKSHGSADAYAFGNALARAYDAARNRLLDQVHDRIVETLQAMPANGDRPAN